MPRLTPPDICGIPWPFEVLIEDLSDHFFLLKDIGYPAEYDYDAAGQVNALSQESLQISPDDPPFDWNYPLRKFEGQIEQPPARALGESQLPWMTARETSHDEFSYFSTSGEYSSQDSIINSLLKMLDSDDEAAENPMRSSSSTDPGTCVSNINGFSGSSDWTGSWNPISGYIDIGLDYRGSDAEDYPVRDHVFSPRSNTMPFPVITIRTPPTEQFYCGSPGSNYLLFPSSIDDSESCYGVFLSPRQSSDDISLPSNSCPMPPTASTILTPKPRYPIPTWFY